MHCFVGSRVLLTNNVFPPSVICNRSTGNVMDIVHVPGTSEPLLYKYIVVYFGTNYIGPTFFLGYPYRAVWVLIHPVTDKWYNKPT